MNKNRNTPTLLALTTSFLTMWCATDALGGITLTNIPLADGNSVNDARAITPDGKFVAGFMGSGAMSYGYGTSAGYLYDVTSGTIYCPILAGSLAGTMNGVAYRTENGTNEVLTSGGDSGVPQWFMTPDSGVTWGGKFRDSRGGSQSSIASWNGMAGTDSDVFYTVWTWENSSDYQIFIGKISGPWSSLTTNWTQKGITKPQTAHMNGVSSSGRAVGQRQTATEAYRHNYALTWNGGSGVGINYNGLAGTTEGEAYCVSADGNTIFGQSPIVHLGANLYGYKATFTGPNGSNDTTLASITQLPNMADVPTNSASLVFPYGCTADGRYLAGMNYRGQEKAALWDTGNADTNLWAVNDLSDLAMANGAGDIFIRLTRAFSVGTNGTGDLVIAGVGADTTFAKRAYVMTLPKWVAAIQFPIRQTVRYGSNVTFSLKTNGTEALSYQWYKNGGALPGATGTAISYSNVSCAGDEAGSYSVVVSNASVSGVVTGAMTLTVLDPFILSQPLNRTHLEGTVATFTVSAGGAPNLSYKWQRNGIDLTDGDTGWGSTIAGSSTPTLTISNVTQNDGTNNASGSYTVVVTTSAGGCTIPSRTASLMVVGVPVLSSIVPDLAGNYTLNISGPYQQIYKVLYSTNLALPLINWTPLVTNTFSGLPEIYMDTAPADPQRYYILASPYVLTP
jgi:hypothetical protein